MTRFIRFVLAVGALGLFATRSPSQSSIRDPFGTFDSLWNSETDAVQIAAAHSWTAVRKNNGTVTIWGSGALQQANCAQVAVGLGSMAMLLTNGTVYTPDPNLQPPAPPPGVTFTQVAVGYGFLLAVRSDGQAVGTGRNVFGQCNVLPPPPGMRYVEVAASSAFQPSYGLGLRSDGIAVAWGMPPNQGVVPVPPPGVTFTSISAGYYHAAAVRSDGLLELWGDNSWGQCTAPTLPPGLRYVQVSAAARHTLALRSDGTVVAFGDNTYGQCNVPALPPGRTYVEVAAGGTPVINWMEGQHSVARRSDGTVVAWGDNAYSQCNAPSPPPGVEYVEVASGGMWGNRLARRSDGSVVAWGDNSNGQCDVPALPAGLRYVELEPCAARRSDGAVVTWGYFASRPAPPLPNQVTYVELAGSGAHLLARRSDGQVVAWGENHSGQCLVPALPPNTTYIAIAASSENSMAQRSDGTVLVWGDNRQGQCSVPWQVQQLGCQQMTTYGASCTALCSDGSVQIWGNTSYSSVPALPFGVSYVGVSGPMARRSDGQVEVLTWVTGSLSLPPPPGGSYMEVADGIARIGPTSTYVTFAAGCPGSRPTTRLLPRNTPRIGAELTVALRDLPLHVAGLCTGTSRSWSPTFGTLPNNLAWLGMPSCSVAIDPAVLSLVVGANHSGTFRITIPYTSVLVGVEFHQQALVPDAAAGNAFGAVLSDAATGVVGR